MSATADWWAGFFHGIAVDLWQQAVPADRSEAEADFIAARVGVRPPAELLDAACGVGRLTAVLARRGYRMTGLDLSADSLERARGAAAPDHAPPPRYVLGNVQCMPWQEAFDGVFCFGNCFGYFTDEGNLDFLRSVARALRSGGRFLLNTNMAAESLLPHLRDALDYTIGDIGFHIDHRYEPSEGRLYSEYTFVRDGRGETRSGRHRVYTYRELCQLLAATGLTVEETFGSLDGQPYRLGSEDLLIVSQKR